MTVDPAIDHDSDFFRAGKDPPPEHRVIHHFAQTDDILDLTAFSRHRQE
jgi:hypothetical protein